MFSHLKDYKELFIIRKPEDKLFVFKLITDCIMYAIAGYCIGKWIV